MVELTELIGRLLASAPDDGVHCLVGTATKGGAPQISPKGSVAVFDTETISYWERSFRTSYDAIEENPQVIIYYRNSKRADEMPSFRGAAMRFHGIARIATDEAERRRAWELQNERERVKDPEMKGAAVLVRIDRVEDLSGTVMER